MLNECPAAPAVGMGRRDLKASANVLWSEEVRCSDLPLAAGGITRTCARIQGRRTHAAARNTSSKIGKRRSDRITRLRGVLHRRHSHVPVGAVVGRVFRTRQGINPLLDAREPLASHLTSARGPRASSWCTGVKPATGRPKGAGAALHIRSVTVPVNRSAGNIRA